MRKTEKRKKLRKVTRFETKTVTCHAGGNLPQNSSEGESSAPLGLDELGTGRIQDRNAEDLDVRPEKRELVEEMDD